VTFPKTRPIAGGGPFLFPVGACAKTDNSIKDNTAVIKSIFLTKINLGYEIIADFFSKPAAYGKRL